jgi:hypothetical protein
MPRDDELVRVGQARADVTEPFDESALVKKVPGLESIAD